MARFTPCQGKNACRDDGLRCLTCGRGLDEVQRLRELMDQLAQLALDFNYDNIGEFSAYVARKLDKTIAYRREQSSEVTSEPNH